MKTKKVILGNSDYSRHQMAFGCGWGDYATLLLDTISSYEDAGYRVEFETSLWRKIFGIGIYRIVAYK